MVALNIMLGFGILFLIMALGIHIASTMFVLGVGVGFIVISVITPIYNLTSSFK